MSQYWNALSSDLGIRVQHDAVLPGLENLGPFETVIECFGGSKGMIVVSDYDSIEDVTRDLIEAGYGYSAFDQCGAYDRESAIEMLRDWGWTCSSPPPSWY